MSNHNKKLRICIDLDGTICEIREPGQGYSEVAPKKGAKEQIDKLHAAGHIIIIHTARNMNSTGHNVGKVLKNIGRVTLEWLDKHGIYYDEIFFGKPNADITIDDRVVRFEDNWSKFTEKYLLKNAKDK
ncbi:MAG: HAD hydrolase family protein [Rickettsiaceae bacterium]